MGSKEVNDQILDPKMIASHLGSTAEELKPTPFRSRKTGEIIKYQGGWKIFLYCSLAQREADLIIRPEDSEVGVLMRGSREFFQPSASALTAESSFFSLAHATIWIRGITAVSYYSGEVQFARVTDEERSSLIVTRDARIMFSFWLNDLLKKYADLYIDSRDLAN